MLEKTPRAVGRALRGVRPGLEKLVFNHPELAHLSESIVIESDVFADRGPIPVVHTADGQGASPPLRWSGLPAETKSVALVIEDADSPTPRPLVHGIAYDLVGSGGSLGQGSLGGHDDGLQLGKNSYQTCSYLPMDPPTGHGPHRYAFQIFALSQPLPESALGRGALVDGLRRHGLARGCLVGLYERP